MVLDISRRLGLTHIGSNLSVLPILKRIYAHKNPKDKVVLDNAHAHLAHLIVKGAPMLTAEEMILKYGIHCDRQAGCDASGGSLGHGLGVSIGMAIAEPRIDVYCIVSDGSIMEGSNWEALRMVGSLKVPNLKIICNFNGYTAVSEIDRDALYRKVLAFVPEMQVELYKSSNGDGFSGVQGHYKKL